MLPHLWGSFFGVGKMGAFAAVGVKPRFSWLRRQSASGTASAFATAAPASRPLQSLAWGWCYASN